MSEIIVNVDAENIPVVQIMVDENSAQTAIDAAAAAQAALDAIGSTNFGDKLDKSTYTGNAQDLKNDIDAIALPDDILIHGAAPVTNGTVNIAANAFRWRLSQIIYNNAAYSNLINPAANGHSRIDLFCLNNLGTFEKVVGDELIGIAPEPAPNAGTLGAFFVAVNGAVIGTPSPIMTSNKPILEREKQPFHVYNTGEINDTFLEDFFYGYLNFRGAVTNLKSIRVYQNTFLYSGKEILVKNSQATDITLFHLTGLGFQFSFPNAQNLVLKPNEIIRFSMKITDPSSGVLEYVGRLTEVPTVAVADVTGLPAALDLKLNTSAYNQHFRGVYLTELALNTALPTANVGDYAQVNVVGATDVVNYNWDAEENIWVINAVARSGALNTDQLPEGSTNLYFTPARISDKVDKVTGERLINAGEITKLTNQSGTNTGDQDLSGKVDKVTEKSLLFDTEIARLLTLVNYNDTTLSSVARTTTLSYALSDTTSNLATGDVHIGYAQYNFTLLNYWISVKNAPTISSVMVDLKKSGVSVTSTKAGIDAAEFTSLTGTAPVLTATTFAKGDLMTANIFQVGSGDTGKVLQLNLEIIKS